ncbi:ATP-binding protein [Gephyromycinifex aptenodytis]|uniref:ATP-binding protein n=1 Tax=Gephyromycinifex aptenodytis TaxID=2716227 RepID=UPI003856054D
MSTTDQEITEIRHAVPTPVGAGSGVKPAASPTDGTRTVRLPHVLYAVRDARRVIVADLTQRGIAPIVIEEAEAVVSELVANSVRHARPLADGCVRVRWKVKGGAVEVEVRDGGGTNTPRPVRPSVWSVRGRGLRIVRSMAHEWGVQDERNGRTVWAALGGPSRRRRL